VDAADASDSAIENEEIFTNSMRLADDVDQEKLPVTAIG
jgi:hypothetical protein